MGTSVTFNGASYTVPAIGDASWGANVSNYLIAISTGCLQKSGGLFTLSADVNFGATYGLVAKYFKSYTSNIAAAGAVRLARADTVSWRNTANNADLALGVTASDVLTFNSIPIVSLALGAAYTVLQMNSGGTAYTWATPTGTGAPVLQGSPTLTTPTLGVATATSINKVAFTAPATGSTLTIADGKTLTASNTLTFVGTDGQTFTFPNGSSTVMTLASADTITGVKTFGAAGNVGKLVIAGNTSGSTILNATAVASGTLTLPAATDTLVGKATTDVLTNKDIDGSTASNTSRITLPKASTSTLSGLTRKQGTIVYDTSLNQVFADDGTNLNPIGSGSGEKNYILTGSNNSGGWSVSGAGITAATDITAADLPRSITTKSGILLTRVSGSSDYAYYRFTLDPADYNTKLKIQFAMKPGASYVASDFKVDMYSNTAANYGGTSTRLALSTDTSSVTALPNITGTYVTSFGSTNASAPYMELRVGLNASTSGTTLCISDVIVGPGVVIQGAAITPVASASFTLTQGFGSSPTQNVFMQRKGTVALFYGSITIGTTPSGTQFILTMPSGMTIDTTYVGSGYNNGSTSNKFLPSKVVYNNGTNTWDGRVVTNGTSSTQLSFLSAGQSGSLTNFWGGSNIPATITAADKIHFSVEIPIAEWAGAGTVNISQNDLAYYFSTGNTWGTTNASATTSIGPGGVLGGTTTPAGTNFYYSFTPSYPVPVGAKPVLEISPDQKNWSPTGANVWGTQIESMRFDGTNYIGAGASIDTTGKIFAWFGKYSCGTSTAWAGTWYWRVSVGLPGQAVGFSNVQQNVSGLVASAGQLLGTNTNDAAAAGYVGETRTSTISSAQNAAASNSLLALANITIAAGDWDVSVSATLLTNSATFSGVCQVIMGRASASSANTTSGLDECGIAPAAQATGQNTVHLSTMYVRSDGTNCTVNGANSVASQTLYLNVLATYSAGTPQWRGTITARRRR